MRKCNLLFLVLSLFTLGLKAQIITTVAGSAIEGYSGDGGPAISAGLYRPEFVAFDATGNMYISDNANHRIRKMNTSGIITTVVGTGTAGYSGDGGPAINAQLHSPYGISFDTKGNLYIADWDNFCIRKVDTAGIITTVIGQGTLGHSPDGVQAATASLDHAGCVIADKAGNLYISETGHFSVRKIDTSGILSTVAGTGAYGYNGDGIPATSAKLFVPWTIALDSIGNLFIADNNNHRIRKVNTSGIISTIAGNGSLGFSGDGNLATSAQLEHPVGLAFDSQYSLYIVDKYRVRKVNSQGIITTIAGNGSQSYSGDGGPAIAASLYVPLGITFDSAQNLYIADSWSNRIRKISGLVTSVPEWDIKLASIFPNPAKDKLTVLFDLLEDKTVEVHIKNVLGQTVQQSSKEQLANGHHEMPFTISDLGSGIYFVNVITNGTVTTQKIVIE